MLGAGFEAWRRSEELSVVGLVEVLAHLPRLLRLNDALARRAIAAKPDVAVLVDAPDFHVRLARKLRRAQIPVVLYVPPAVWASRRGRVQTHAGSVDRILVLFPFERDIWAQAGGAPATWVGHPLADDIQRPIRPADLATAPIALLPGSRPGELSRHLPVLRQAAERLAPSTFVVPVAARAHRAQVESAFWDLPVTVFDGDDAVRAAVGRASAALVASGTATLETALLGCPQVVFYRLHALTYALARRLMTCGHWALPNVLVESRAVPELIQDQATATGLADAVRAQRARGSSGALALAAAVRARLTPPTLESVASTAADRAADEVWRFVEERRTR